MIATVKQGRLAEKIAGCWRGKAIGGTLGAPHEGKPGPLNLRFYDPVPRAMLPNDDLDLQLVWLHHLRATHTKTVTPEWLAKAWQSHVQFPFDEYGVCLRNLHYGLKGAAVGAFDNWFAECMGGVIRSEIWACLAAGEPERAAGFAWADAVCDHAGDGVWAEVFMAALQAAAFTVDHPCAFGLLDPALELLPADSRVRRAITDTRGWFNTLRDWRAVRTQIMARYGHPNFTDVAQNLAFTILGWLAGDGDFGRSICIAVNCGQDADCTGATLGALLGILNPEIIPEAWLLPIGEQIIVSPPIVGIHAPATLTELTQWTLEARHQLRQTTASVGPVAPLSPAQLQDAVLPIDARQAWVTAMDQPHPEVWKNIQLPGHWIVRRYADFAAPVMLLQFVFTLAAPAELCVMACGSTSTHAWVDGAIAEPMPPGFGCQYTSIAVPSFHRGGCGHYRTGPLTPGRHELTVAWTRPEKDGISELVIGLGTWPGKQWLPGY